MGFTLFRSSLGGSSTADAAGAMDMARAAAGLQTENDSCCPSMSMETRLYGFVGCFLAGWVLSFFSMFALSTLNINAFVVMYSLGNITVLLSMGFLMGPMRQLRGMFAQTRIIGTIVYLGALVATLVVALRTHNLPATIVCVVIQFFASVWYAISYIPFARQAVMNCCGSAVGTVS